MRLNRFYLAAALILLPAGPAFAQDGEREIDGWTLVDDGESCAMSRLNDDSNGLTMLHDGKSGTDAMAFIRLDLGDVVNDRTETLQISVDGSEWLDISAQGMVLEGGASGFRIQGFPIAEFAAADHSGELRFRRGGKVIHSFPMDDMRRATEALVACGKKY